MTVDMPAEPKPINGWVCNEECPHAEYYDGPRCAHPDDEHQPACSPAIKRLVTRVRELENDRKKLQHQVTVLQEREQQWLVQANMFRITLEKMAREPVIITYSSSGTTKGDEEEEGKDGYS